MRRVAAIAEKEIREGMRNHWIVATTLLLATLSLALAFIGSAPTGTVKASALDLIVVSLSSLTSFLIPLIGLLIAYEAIVGELERGTLLLLLSYPAARWEVLAGKFLGHLAILCFATLFGYGAAALVVATRGAITTQESWLAFLAMIGSSIMLGAVFVAIGYAISVQAASRGAAAAAAVGVWLLFVLLYDMALLGILVADKGDHIGARALNALLLLNPADIYRLFNLSAFANVSLLSGMSGLAKNIHLRAPVLLGGLLIWIVVPLLIASVAFGRKEL
ncbi:ABC transporter permease subunit [Methylocystis sp. JAN1]|uniref:ABC transporter permease subunit n=1 Tax=Methylocystis sp. JAN1 TaxID=3397211 RepID=UPI003FA3422D